MAVRSVGATYTRFIGLSADEKPMDVENGAEYLVADTGERWDFFDGMWILNMLTAALPARVLTTHKGTWRNPYIYGDGLAYEWYDTEGGCKRLKVGAVPTSISDGEMILTG